MEKTRMLAPTRVTSPARRGAYVRGLVSHPATWVTTAIMFAVALSQVGIVVALAVLLGSVLTVDRLAGCGRVQRALDDRRHEDELRRRRCKRETRVEQADVPLHELRSLAGLVARIDRADVGHYELDALLDRYADLAVAHASCDKAMRSLDRTSASRALASIATDDAATARRAVLQRQLECWKRHQQQAQRYREEMLAISELVKLIALRGGSPDTSTESGEIQRRLAQLDDEDAARRELEA